MRYYLITTKGLSGYTDINIREGDLQMISSDIEREGGVCAMISMTFLNVQVELPADK